jgi:hypothetical protein
MKSSLEVLRKRGLPYESDILQAKQLSVEQLYIKLASVLSAERSAVAAALRDKDVDQIECTTRLLEALETEKSLYTKLEICKTLEKGNETTARIMCNYLGKIGNNQHLYVPEQVSRKKCYPLPRDIIARSLGRMDKSVFPVLAEQTEIVDKRQLLELLDAIGHLVFCNKELANDNNFAPIIRLYEKYKADELIVWKIAMCCSGFSIRQSIDILDNIEETTTNDTILLEVKRSRRLQFR